MIKSSYLRAIIMIRVLGSYYARGADFSALTNEQKEHILDCVYKTVYDYATEKGISINEAIQTILPR